MKKCIACDELIGKEALVCIHCGESLAPGISEDGSVMIIPEHNFEKISTLWINNTRYYKDFFPMFGWTQTKEEHIKIEQPSQIWSRVRGIPEETISSKTFFTLKRKKSIVKPELKSIETDFFHNLRWVSAKNFDRTFGADAFIFMLFLIGATQWYFDIRILNADFTILAGAFILMCIYGEYVISQKKKFENQKRLSHERFKKYLKILKKHVKSDVLDEYLAKHR